MMKVFLGSMGTDLFCISTVVIKPYLKLDDFLLSCRNTVGFWKALQIAKSSNKSRLLYLSVTLTISRGINLVPMIGAKGATK